MSKLTTIKPLTPEEVINGELRPIDPDDQLNIDINVAVSHINEQLRLRSRSEVFEIWGSKSDTAYKRAIELFDKEGWDIDAYMFFSFSWRCVFKRFEIKK